MRIAYLCRRDTLTMDGISAKIAAQTSRWRANGHEAEIFCLSPAVAGEQQQLPARVYEYSGLAGRAAATVRLQRDVVRWRPDVAYVRYDMWVPPLAVLQRRIPTVVEIQTDDRYEWRLARSRGARLYNAATRRLLLSQAKGLVSVSHELAGAYASFGKPTAVIANGVELNGRPAPPPQNQRGRMVLLSRENAAWHGVDKALDLARALPEWDLVIVGLGEASLGDVPPNVEVVPHTTRDRCLEILATADVGVGPLALHRNGMEEASALKVRDYLLTGLPVVTGCRDTDFLDAQPWFLLRLPNTERNVVEHVDAVRTFADAMRGRRVPREEVAPAIGVEAKEQARLAFLRDVAGGTAQPARTNR